MAPKPKNIKKVFNSLADLAEIKKELPSGREHFIVPAQIAKKIYQPKSPATYEKVYIPNSTTPTQESYDGLGDLRTRINTSLDRQMELGYQVSPWLRKTIFNVASTYPGSAKFLPEVPFTGDIKYSSNPQVLGIPDFFKPQQYRGIRNIDDMFLNAGTADNLGMQRLAKQSLGAGLNDAAALAGVPGASKTQFKYNIFEVPSKASNYESPKVEIPQEIEEPEVYPEYNSNPEILATPDFYSWQKYRGTNDKVDKHFRWANYANESGMMPSAMNQLNEALSAAAYYAGVPGAQMPHIQYNTKNHVNYSPVRFPAALANQLIDYAKQNNIWQPWMTTTSGLFSTWFDKKAPQQLKDFYESLNKK